jgi:hypothetical protein
MQRAAVEPGVELEYRLQGTGEPVVLLHAGLFADWFQPLLDEPAIAARHRVLSLHRVGYAGSGRMGPAPRCMDDLRRRRPDLLPSRPSVSGARPRLCVHPERIPT